MRSKLARLDRRSLGAGGIVEGMTVPDGIATPRFALRSWRPDDAEALLPVLEANQAHIAPWIPLRVSQPVPLADLRQRLAGFAALFADDREWRYALVAPDESRPGLEMANEAATDVYGEVDLFPRNANGRVHLSAADRAEIGYWLREDLTGRGLITEAVQAIIAVARGVGAFRHLEIRCDARNVASAAVPRRLGFALASIEMQDGVREGEAPVELQTWTLLLDRSPASRR
jgi:RimJ/RimL family protein N-acetyltransferase